MIGQGCISVKVKRRVDWAGGDCRRFGTDPRLCQPCLSHLRCIQSVFPGRQCAEVKDGNTAAKKCSVILRERSQCDP